MNPPTLSVKSVRSLLLNECDEKSSALFNLMYADGYLRDYFADAIRHVREEIIMLDSYEDLDKFIGDHYRMSLEDWVNSL
jgi:hypothetical protein